jgi:hypothetical protein
MKVYKCYEDMFSTTLIFFFILILSVLFGNLTLNVPQLIHTISFRYGYVKFDLEQQFLPSVGSDFSFVNSFFILVLRPILTSHPLFLHISNSVVVAQDQYIKILTKCLES